MKSIFVGNLDFHVVEDDVRQLFGQYGQVERVALMTDRETGRSRGFAFVEMANMNEGEKAIAELNGSQFGGRTLNVNEARPKPARSEGRNIEFSKSAGKQRGGRW
jgi:cold-inducible RNA-binding protein